MSPEQIMTPNLIDKRTDIFSFGLVVYELMNGITPRCLLEDKTQNLEEKTIKENEFKSLSDYASGKISISKSKDICEEYFNDVIRDCLKEKENRFTSMKTVSKKLKEIYSLI